MLCQPVLVLSSKGKINKTKVILIKLTWVDPNYLNKQLYSLQLAEEMMSKDRKRQPDFGSKHTIELNIIQLLKMQNETRIVLLYLVNIYND